MAVEKYLSLSIITDITETVLGVEINPLKIRFIEQGPDTAKRIRGWFIKQPTEIKLKFIEALDAVIYGTRQHIKRSKISLIGLEQSCASATRLRTILNLSCLVQSGESSIILDETKLDGCASLTDHEHPSTYIVPFQTRLEIARMLQGMSINIFFQAVEKILNTKIYQSSRLSIDNIGQSIDVLEYVYKCDSKDRKVFLRAFQNVLDEFTREIGSNPYLHGVRSALEEAQELKRFLPKE